MAIIWIAKKQAGKYGTHRQTVPTNSNGMEKTVHFCAEYIATGNLNV